MSTPLPDQLLARFGDFIAERMALHFDPSRWPELELAARSVSGELGFPGPEAFIEELISSPLTRETMDVLASRLTIGETYFWREPRVFEALEGRILPELIRLREAGEKRLRIWCAGCSTGEEAYSIAIALRRSLPAIEDWNVTILATDIDPRALRRAKAGAFGAWSFRNAPAWLVEGFFRTGKDGKREILPTVGEMVSFAYLNLAEDIYPSLLNETNAMDIIFCRNVLMYFSAERARRIVESLGRALVDGGWLLVSACECSQALFPEFAAVQFPEATGYRKKSPEAPRAAVSSGHAIPRAAMAPIRAPAEPLFVFKRRAPPNPRAEEAAPESRLSARELADRGRLSEALASCEAEIAENKLDPRLYELLANIYQELGRDEDAIASLKRAIYLDPESIPACFALGNLAFRGGDARTGRRYYKNSLTLLAERGDEDILSDSEGLSAGKFREIITATMRIDREAL